MRPKKYVIVVLAIFLTVSFSLAAYAFKCKVKKIEGGKLTVKCKKSDIKKETLKIGDKFKVRKMIEGC